MLIVNLYGQPGAGKSTNASRLFSILKDEGINCELITEFAKDLVWEDRNVTLKNQIYIFAKQYHKIYRIKDKVDVIITDSPILLSAFYDDSNFENFLPLIKEVNSSFNLLNVFLNRVKKYNPIGRLQTEKESDEIYLKLKNFINENSINYIQVDGDIEGCNIIKNNIIGILNGYKIREMN
jgi:GTPase SAR1 family protein